MTAPLPESAGPTSVEPMPEQTEHVVAIRRRTVDRLLLGLGAVVAVVLVIAGGLLTWGANFANDYVHRELSSQQIFFPSEEELTTEGRTDLVSYADEQVTTGSEAEAYASFINGHLQGIADGKTFSELGETQTEARNAVTEAQDSNASDDDIAPLQANLDTVNGQRDSLFRGETLRGLLLSTYAWSTIGEIARIASIAAFVAAAVMIGLVIAGLIHMQRQHSAT